LTDVYKQFTFICASVSVVSKIVYKMNDKLND